MKSRIEKRDGYDMEIRHYTPHEFRVYFIGSLLSGNNEDGYDVIVRGPIDDLSDVVIKKSDPIADAVRRSKRIKP